MKVQHFARRGKQKNKKFAKLFQFPSVESDRSHYNSDSRVAESSTDSECYFKSKIYDRDDGYTNWNIPSGDHCIVGNSMQLMRLATYLIGSCRKQIEVVGISDFLQSSADFSFIKSGIRLVIVDTSRTSPEFIGSVISKSTHAFIHRPENLLEYHPNKNKYRISTNAKMIVSGIAAGMGMDVMRVIDFLCGVMGEEFLEVSNVTDKRWVRSLSAGVDLSKKKEGRNMGW